MRFLYVQRDRAAGFAPFFERKAEIFHIFDRFYQVGIFVARGFFAVAYGGNFGVSRSVRAAYYAFENFVIYPFAVGLECHYAR